jgi:predicted transposase/invertase (TIGR01784 family)
LQQGEQGESEMATIAQEFIREGYERGIEKGIEKGRLEEKRQIARQLLLLLDLRQVSQITGLPVEELRRLS